MGSIRDKDRDTLRRICRLVLGGVQLLLGMPGKGRDMLDMGLRREDNRGMHKRAKGILLGNRKDMLLGKDRDTLVQDKGTLRVKDKDTYHLGKDKAMRLLLH